MVIYDFNFKCIVVFPIENNPPLFVNPNAIKFWKLSVKFFLMIGWRNP